VAKFALALQLALAILGVWLLLSWAQGATAQAAEAIGQCSDWIDIHNSSDENAAAQFLVEQQDWWVEGFLAALLPKTVPDDAGVASSISVWMGNYCRKHPAQSIRTAAEALVKSKLLETDPYYIAFGVKGKG
jgi:hypothetical protein